MTTDDGSINPEEELDYQASLPSSNKPNKGSSSVGNFKERTFELLTESTHNYRRSSNSVNVINIAVESPQSDTVDVTRDRGNTTLKEELDYQVSLPSCSKPNTNSSSVGKTRYMMPDQSNNGSPAHFPVINRDYTARPDYPNQSGRYHLPDYQSLETSSHHQESIKRIRYGQMGEVKDSRNTNSLL